MSTFQVPYSASPTQPSTPDASSKRTNSSHAFHNTLAPHPSTTPLGPPPSSVGSFTPDGPPPQTLLGSSQIDDDDLSFRSSNGFLGTFSKSKVAATDTDRMVPLGRSHRSDMTSPRGSLLNSKGSQASKKQSYMFERSRDDAAFGLDADYDDDDFAFPSLYSSKSSGTFKSPKAQTSALGTRQRYPPVASPENSFSEQQFTSPRGAKRSRTGKVIADSPPQSLQRWNRLGNSVISSIAQSIATSMKPAALVEPRDFVVNLEKCLRKYSAVLDGESHNQQDLQTGVGDASQSTSALLDQWIPEHSAAQDQVESFQIGPDDESLPLQKAAWLSVLLLRTHSSSHDDIDRLLSKSARGSMKSNSMSKPISVPRILLDWMNQCHNPWVSMATEVGLQRPSPPAHYNFWDIILILVLRGRLESAIFLLQRSDFHHAESALNDGHADGYTAIQAENIKGKIGRVIQVLSSCPGILGDWHVNSNPWALFRKDARNSLVELDSLADKGRGASRSNRQIDELIPWTVYQSLRILHGILLGNETEILASAQDWVEATVGLAVWKKDDDSAKMMSNSLISGTQSLTHSMFTANPSEMVIGNNVSLQRLSRSFRRATDDNKGDGFQINTNRALEVGLACIFEGDYENVIGILRGWSLPVTDAVLELATAGGWYSPDPSVSDAVMQNFDDDDLMVLSTYGRTEGTSLRRDSVMVEYASALFKRGEQHGSVDVSNSEWQLAISIMMRIGNRAAYSQQIDDILSQIKIDSDATMDLALDMCHRCGMERRGCTLAEVNLPRTCQQSRSRS